MSVPASSPNRVRLRLLAVGAVAALALPRLAAAQTSADTLPVPPQQSQPWTPPATTLPPLVVDAVAQLFRDGLPDPRGCDYREIEIAETKQWTFKTHGWVLPGHGAQKYAIGWNGVIYPVVSVGAAFDLTKEIAALPGGLGRFRGNGNGWPMGDEGSLNVGSGLPIQVAFLLRLGRPKLAEQMWDAGCAGADDMKAKDPYAEMAAVWLDRWFNRAKQAFLNRDDASALAICRQLSPVVARVKATAGARGIADPWPVTFTGDHLWQLPVLEADVARRVREKPSTPVIVSGQPARGPARIAALIRDLDQAYAEQMSNPGETDIDEDPTVQALENEGAPAVEPLLKCLVEDNRLTRARFTEGMDFDGPIIPVYEAAYKALFRILNVSFPLFDDDSQGQKEPRDLSLEDRMALETKIAAVWKKTRGMSFAASGYLTLRDDHAGPKEWFRAIDAICQPADGRRTSYALLPVEGSWYTQSRGGFQARGESLRAKKNPSVSDLIIRRFEQLVQQKPGDDCSLDQLTDLLLALADWDGKNHLADLARLGEEMDVRFLQETGSRSAQVNVALAEKRLELGDSTALADYLAYLRGLKPDDLKPLYTNGDASCFRILWHYPDDPGARQTAEKFFGAKDAPLVPLPNDLAPTPLIGLPAFRRELLRGLDDKSPAGAYTVREGAYDCQFTATQGSFSGSPVPTGPDVPKPGASVAFRLCDNYAFDLAQIAGFPACRLYWPEAKRDAAVAACKAMLQQYGDALRDRPGDPYDQDPGLARLRIGPLDHPATPEDVQAGRALFSLPGAARVWKMPSYPLGPAFQAEEALEQGQWRRYFGLFRDGRPVKVPAEEVDFPGPFPSTAAVTPEISGALQGPEDRVPTDFGFFSRAHHFLALGAPVPVTVTVCNHNGADQAVPAALMLPPGAAKMLPEGLAFAVSRSDQLPPMIERFDDPPFDGRPFHDLPMRHAVTLVHGKALGPKLFPTQTFTVFHADLRDYFDFSRPGTYHVTALFHVPGQPATRSPECAFSIAPATP